MVQALQSFGRKIFYGNGTVTAAANGKAHRADTFALLITIIAEVEHRQSLAATAFTSIAI